MELQLLKNPIILALDIDDPRKAFDIAKELMPSLGAVKIGPRMVQRLGPEGCKKLSDLGPIFIDNKYFDIPSTMVSAVRSAFELGATLVTIHAMSGSEALADLKKLEMDLNQIRPFKILCVSILTSFKPETLPSILKGNSIAQMVSDLALDVKTAGLTGLVCSPQEIELIKDMGLYSVVPGIRDHQDQSDDQSRTLSAKEALKKGASALVIGRPILQAPDPRTKINQILASL